MVDRTGNNRNNELEGSNGADVLIGRGGNDELDGNAGNDKLYGGAGNDELDGDAGNDLLEGGKGNDDLDGGAGRDKLYGGAGRDSIDGGAGADLLFGGAGADVFTFGSRDGKDLIGDFQRGDRIEFDIDDLRFSDLSITNNRAGDAVITWGDPAGSSITLDGVDAAQLSRSDFLFDS